MLDPVDLKILSILQRDCTLSVADIGKEVGLSTTPCWRRIQRLEQDGVIDARVALLNAKKVNAGVTVFVAITTSEHNIEWLERFHTVRPRFPGGGRSLPHERAGRLPPARRRAGHREL